MKKIINKLITFFASKKTKAITTHGKSHGWFGNYSKWEDAKKKCTGYDDFEILEKVKSSVLKVKNGEAVYERDSVIFDEIQYSQPLLDIFKEIVEKNDNSLNIVDFGGSLGSSYFQNRSFLSSLNNLNWNVVEQPHFVECGKKHIEDNHLKFYYTIEEALKENINHVLFLSSVIPYFEDPFELIKKMLTYKFEYIIIDRTAFIESDKDRITVQIVPEFIYKASYPAWFFNEQKFVSAFLSDYELVKEFDSKFDPREKLDDGVWSYRKGFVFKRKP
ncbi:TIGR04325 family methyltransferase [Vicingus serpentipes]|uniref:TIGR04325 family methyltransferase n=1 Tax=Vicingus serpentipes TaxID=1926625 RepID=UPI0014770C59|nr:TIGR04325 family methyltransferase [Vicingus serpentipes]